jgi:phosphoglycolate phosphatase
MNSMGNNTIKCLIFDWDGTLADSTAAIVACMQAAIEQNGLPARSGQEIRDIIGLGLVEAVICLYPDTPGINHERLADSYRQYYRTHYRGKTSLYPQVIQVLEKLHERDYFLAIATGKSRRGLDSSLEETGTRHFFHMSRCADETFSKPHPQMLHDILSVLDVPPENTLMIGDSSYDIEMARAAGCHPVAVSYGSQERQRLLEYNPLVCLETLEELIPWLERQD